MATSPIAIGLGYIGLHRICANCYIYNWEQPGGKISLRCGRCKVFYYCGKECQEEHYRKTHKHHCKFLCSRAKMAEKKSELQHDKRTCPYCISQDSAGDDLFLDSNPNYACIDDPSDVPASQKPMLQYMSLVTHQADDRMERMVKVMQRLLVKMKLTNHPTYQRHPNEMEEIDNGLLNLRERIYNERLFDSKGYHMKVKYMKGASNDTVLTVSNKIGKRSDCFKTWETYMILTALFVFVETVRLGKMLKSPETSLPRELRETTKKVDPFLEKVDQILEALQHQVVPHSQLAAIACEEGKPEQKCSSCQKEITVTGILYPEVPLWCIDVPVVLLYPTEDVSYSCGSEKCTSEALKSKRESFSTWSAAVGATVMKLGATKCDFCFLLAPLKEVHRSLCKTKNYCSSICRNADDIVHNVCCRQGIVEARKVKKGGKEKPEVANRNLDLFVTSFENEGLGDQKTKKIISKMKKTKLRDGGRLRELENRASEVD